MNFLKSLFFIPATMLIMFVTSCDRDKVKSKPVTGVALFPREIILSIGETKELTVFVSPEDADNKSVAWSAKDPEIAAVSSNSVTGISEGSTYVVVTALDGNFQDSALVTVSPPVGSGKYLPSEVTENYDDVSYTYKYFYDDRNRLIKACSYDNNDDDFLFITQVFIYESDKLARIESFVLNDQRPFLTTFSYNDNQVMVDQEIHDKTLHDTFVYELNENNQVVKADCDYPLWDDQYSIWYDYDAPGNCIRAEAHNKDGTIDISDIFYDNKKGVCSNVNMPSWILMHHSPIPFFANHANNVSGSENNYGIEDDQYEYEYNVLDYPVKVTIKTAASWKSRTTNPYHVRLKKDHARLKKAANSTIYEFSIQYIEAK